MDAAAGNDHRAASTANQLSGFLNPLPVWRLPIDAPHDWIKEPTGKIPRMGLDVLRQRDDRCPCLSGIGENAHRVGKCSEQLLGARDAIEETTHRTEAVVHTSDPPRSDVRAAGVPALDDASRSSRTEEAKPGDG